MAKMTIAIIGATEMMGAAIAKNLSKGNYRLLLFGLEGEKMESLVEEIKYLEPAADIESLHCLVDASWEADIIISALPCGSEREIAERIREVATQKIVIICSTKMGDGLNEAVTSHMSAAEELQNLLPYSKVVKTFNNTLTSDFGAGSEVIDSFIAGNDPEAVQTVCEIVSNAGFHPIVAGELATSRVLEKHHAD
jgi:predicted dinucleotide-binding enzyme